MYKLRCNYSWMFPSLSCSHQVLLAVCRTLLCPCFTEQVSQFLLPAMAYGKYPFPFVELIQALITHTSESAASDSKYGFSPPTSAAASSSSSSMASVASRSKTPPHNLLSSPWLLLSILTIGEKKMSKSSCLCVCVCLCASICVCVWLCLNEQKNFVKHVIFMQYLLEDRVEHTSKNMHQLSKWTYFHAFMTRCVSVSIFCCLFFFLTFLVRLV